MEPHPPQPITPTRPDRLQLILWEDYQQHLDILWNLSAALKQAYHNKRILHLKLQSLIQLKAESLSRLNEVEEMRDKVEARRLKMETISARGRVTSEDANKEEQRLRREVRSFLLAGTALSVATKQLQESDRSLSEERGYGQLRNMQRMLRLRQQHMVSQVSLLYPVKITAGSSEEQELESFPNSTKSGNYTGSKPVNQGSLTILGLHLTMLPFTKMIFFTSKKEVQKSASALGYVAHAVSLISSYLQVPLRYPLQLGGSRSYISDPAPSVEPTSSDLSSAMSSNANVRPTEFPLFLEGQDTTRAAYAVFLLNKDLEQLLNYIGVRSLGPRHVLANLKELTRTIQSAEFLET